MATFKSISDILGKANTKEGENRTDCDEYTIHIHNLNDEGKDRLYGMLMDIRNFYPKTRKTLTRVLTGLTNSFENVR